MTVFFGLYPTVMLLTIFVGPFTAWMGFSYSMLIGNALSVSILQWIVVPMLMVPLSRWLKAKPGNWALSLGGLGLLTLLLVLFLNLITFRGAIVQDLVRKLTQYFAPQHHKTIGSDLSSTQPSPPDF